MLETLDYAIRIGSTPTFLYFDLYLYSAYAAHYVYFTFWEILFLLKKNAQKDALSFKDSCLQKKNASNNRIVQNWRGSMLTPPDIRKWNIS